MHTFLDPFCGWLPIYLGGTYRLQYVEVNYWQY